MTLTLNTPALLQYLSSHPWLKFNVKMQDAPPTLWIMLGECASKCEHIAGVPLRPSTAEKLHQVYLIKGAVATTAIEGNTLSEKEILDHISGDAPLPPSREYQVQEIENIIDACNGIFRDVMEEKQLPISPERLQELNKMVLKDLEMDNGIVPGEIRTYPVGILQFRYRGAPHQECDYLLARLCEWLLGDDFKPAAGLEIPYAILKAILAHLYLAWIHPFGDGNGRTARLLEFQILIASGVPAPAAQLLSNHYNLTRSEYYRQLDKTSKSNGEVIPFIAYAVQGLVDQLRQQINEIQKQQFDVTWRNYVHELFKNKSSAADHRRKRLALEITSKNSPVPLSGMMELSPAIAVDYSKKSKTTLVRDVNSLQALDLIKSVEGGYVANTNKIKAFLPHRAKICSETK
jgi:Fic family protein